MNCLEFRRQKLADPRRLSAQAQSHLQGCPGCTEFAQGVDETERSLEQALAVPVPEGLADRVLLGRRGAGRVAWRTWAIAAAVVLAIALGFGHLKNPPSDQYARLAIEHVQMEPESFTTVRHADAEAFRSILEDFGGTLKQPLGRIRYIKLCPLDEGTGWHIVFETPGGLATLILVPGKHPGSTETATVGGWNALARPTRNGYYAVVTASLQMTSRVDSAVRERIEWKS